MNSNNSLDQRINEAAKILMDNNWSYLDCIKVLKSTTSEYSIRAVETGRSPNTVPTWGGNSPVIVPRTDGGSEFNPVRVVRTNEGITTTPYIVTEQSSTYEAPADKDVVCSVFSKLG